MWHTFTKRWERCAYKKKHDNVPGKSYYRYDDSFKKRVVSDLSQGLISERKAALLYNVNRQTLSKCRVKFTVVEGEQPVLAKIKKPKVDAALVLNLFSLEQVYIPIEYHTTETLLLRVICASKYPEGR